MLRRPRTSTRTDTPCPYPTLVQSPVLSHDIGNGHYYAYEVPWRRTRKLTAGLPSFWDTYRERNVRNGMDYYTVKLAGWSKDGRYVVMSDHFDLWALPRRPDDAAMPIRLTPDGRERRISYTWLDLEGKVRWFRNLVRPAPEDAQRSEEPTSDLQ